LKNADFQLFDKISALVIVLDRDGLIVHCNRTCSEFSGYALEEVRGRHVRDVLQDSGKLESALLEGLRAGEVPGRFECYWVTKSGDRRWLTWSTTFMVGPDGQVEYVIGTGIDRTTEEKRVEELRNSEAKLKGIVSIAADAIITIDEEQRIVIYNQGAEDVFGWRRDEALGKPLDILLPEFFRGSHRQHLRDFATGTVNARRMGERGRRIEAGATDRPGETTRALTELRKLEISAVRARRRAPGGRSLLRLGAGSALRRDCGTAGSRSWDAM